MTTVFNVGRITSKQSDLRIYFERLRVNVCKYVRVFDIVCANMCVYSTSSEGQKEQVSFNTLMAELIQFKGGPKPSENEINEILGSKRDD